MVRDDALLADWHERALSLEREIGGAVVGQARAIRLILTAVLARGHVLLAGDVGVGKTTLLRAFAQVLGGRFVRVEGTIDLMPGDLLYHVYIGPDGRPAVAPGPLIRHGEDLAVFFFNEINRARPQVHALLLRAMAERSATAFEREHRFPHLLVFADRNRLEREETFEISSAARDRFMMEVPIDAPVDDAERAALMLDPRFHDTDALVGRLPAAMVPFREIDAVAELIQRSVAVSEAMQRYALALWRATAAPADFGVRLPDVDTGELVLAGASPRGMSLAMRAARVTAWLDGRAWAMPEDLQAVFAETIAHRLCFQPVHELRREQIAPRLAAAILQSVGAP